MNNKIESEYEEYVQCIIMFENDKQLGMSYYEERYYTQDYLDEVDSYMLENCGYPLNTKV